MTQQTYTSPAYARIQLRSSVTCPHCWESYKPDDTLWVAEDPSLLGDERLGSDEQRRFLPDRFDVEGNAVDTGGFTCRQLACPNCHLVVPRALYELQPIFISIIGSPACGKSYFLASMTWSLRRLLPQHFGLSFTDTDPLSNAILNEYEERQFFNPNQDELVKLDKTELHGAHLYDDVQFGEQVVQLPRPFYFTIRPSSQHPNANLEKHASRVLCLYDNAGESFQPGMDTTGSQVTRHLARSEALLFLYDPTQDTRFRAACQGKSDDPQVAEAPVTARQETVLHEMADRIRRFAGLNQNEKHASPLIVVVTKYDAWSHLFEPEPLPEVWTEAEQNGVSALDVSQLQHYSDRLRELLWQYSPELVSGAEAFSKAVLYFPASAIGGSPKKLPSGVGYGVRPRDMSPCWVEAPMLLVLSSLCRGLIAQTKTEQREATQVSGRSE